MDLRCALAVLFWVLVWQVLYGCHATLHIKGFSKIDSEVSLMSQVRPLALQT
jgi:hypothetical protein